MQCTQTESMDHLPSSAVTEWVFLWKLKWPMHDTVYSHFKIPLNDQLYQCRVELQYFGAHLCLLHQQICRMAVTHFPYLLLYHACMIHVLIFGHRIQGRGKCSKEIDNNKHSFNYQLCL
jgi:hypothetical protein